MSDRPSPLGQLYGIGVGPGDPELISLKGWRILQRVPVVAFPAGIGGKAGLAQRIADPWIQPDQQQMALNFPYTQDLDILTQSWYTSAETVWQQLQAGRDVAFLAEGDVSFYSTFTYLAQTLHHLHPEVVIHTIPGICSPMAAAAVLSRPLTVRSQRLLILPALYAVTDLETALQQADVLVLMKVSSVYEQVWAVLQQHQLLASSAVVEWATLPQQAIYRDLSDRPHLQLSYFSLLIVQVNPVK